MIKYQYDYTPALDGNFNHLGFGKNSVQKTSEWTTLRPHEFLNRNRDTVFGILSYRKRNFKTGKTIRDRDKSEHLDYRE